MIDRDTQHIIPTNDLWEHDESPDCLCGPKHVGGVYVHHSLDGREFREHDYKGPPMRRERNARDPFDTAMLVLVIGFLVAIVCTTLAGLAVMVALLWETPTW